MLLEDIIGQLILIALLAIIIYLIFKRRKDKGKEKFEDRNN